MTRSRLPRILLPLRHRDFGLLLLGQTVSIFGNNFFLIALPFQLIALGATPVQLGIAVTLAGISTLLFLLLGGVIADRASRRRIILVSDVIGAVITGAIGTLGFFGQLQVEHLYAAALVLGGTSAFRFPAYTAIITELVPEDLLTEANAARTLGGAIGRTAGPVAAGLVVAFFGTPVAFGIDALTFIFSFLAFLAAHPTARPATAAAPILAQVREGISFVAATRWLWMALVALTFINLSYGGQVGVMTPLLVRDTLHAGAATFGAVTAAFGVGRIVGGFVLPQLRITRPGIAMYVFEALAGVATLGIGLITTVPAAIIGMALMGLALSSSDTLFDTMIQRNVPRGLLGRVTSVNFFVGSLFVPLSPLVAGAVVDAAGPPMSFIVAGVWAAAIALLLLVISPVRALR
ncbi:MAG TPA: MFS transporter [Candidatus Limnocylindrales bacterium]|nr:MFS transporter [Candidatus Limnocylindrales bacterium]